MQLFIFVPLLLCICVYVWVWVCIPQEPANKHAAYCSRIEQQSRHVRVCVCIVVLMVTVSNQFLSVCIVLLCMRSAPVELSNYLNAFFFRVSCFLCCSIENPQTVNNNTRCFFASVFCVSVCMRLFCNIIHSASAFNVNKNGFVDKINTNVKFDPLWYLFCRYYDNWERVLLEKKITSRF